MTFLLFQVSKDEITKLVSGFDNQDILTGTGVTLAGQRYIYLSGTDRVIRAKLGKVGVHCMKTTQGTLVWVGLAFGLISNPKNRFPVTDI